MGGGRWNGAGGSNVGEVLWHILFSLNTVSERPSENSAWVAAMAAGDVEAAWRESDAVLAARDPAASDDPTQPYHRRWVWDGRPVDGRDVLVRCYHGLGDTLQFCRYLPALRTRARHLVLETQPELIPLLRRLPGPDRILPFDPANPAPPGECTLEIMELAHALRLPPDPAPYLALPRRPAARPHIGLCWRASPTWDPDRSIPDALLHDLLRTPGCDFVSLQRGAALPSLPDDCPAAILDTAHRIAGLDLVITVDTMVAHLAGALGVPLRLLLRAEPDWRWRAGGTGSVWYRDVVKYLQPAPGDWATPLARLARRLTHAASRGTFANEAGC